MNLEDNWFGLTSFIVSTVFSRFAALTRRLSADASYFLIRFANFLASFSTSTSETAILEFNGYFFVYSFRIARSGNEQIGVKAKLVISNDYSSYDPQCPGPDTF